MLFATLFLISIAPTPPKCVEKLEASATPESGKTLTAAQWSALAVLFHETGKKLVSEHKTELATQSFLLSASIDKHYVAPHLALGSLYEALGNRACAKVHYRRVVDLESDPEKRRAAREKMKALSGRAG